MPEPARPAASATLSPIAADAIPADAVASVEALGLEARGQSVWQLSWRRFRRHRLAMLSLGILVLLTLAVVFAGVLSTYGYAQVDTTEILRRPGQDGHLLGTDTLGRDQLARLLYGGRISLAVGLAVALVSTAIGTTIGAWAGYFGGKLDNLLMRMTDLFLSIPLLIILIFASKILGGRIIDIVTILSLFFWMPVARIIRGVFLSLKEKEFVEAARAVGASNRRIIVRHLLPNAVGPIIVNATLSVAAAILTESLLSFLGFGIQPPTPTWGNMLSQNKGFTLVAPWLVWFPGLAIVITVLAVNFLGDGLRDAFDPSQRRVRR